MAKITITMEAWKCQRCQHVWIPHNKFKNEPPIGCPKCKSPYWNRARKYPERKQSAEHTAAIRAAKALAKRTKGAA